MGGISGGGRGAMRKVVRRIIGGVLILGLGLVGWRILSSPSFFPGGLGSRLSAAEL
jgi:hypothetical protein